MKDRDAFCVCVCVNNVLWINYIKNLQWQLILSLLSQCYQRKKKITNFMRCGKGLFERQPPRIFLFGGEQAPVLALERFGYVGKEREFKIIHGTEVAK